MLPAKFSSLFPGNIVAHDELFYTKLMATARHDKAWPTRADQKSVKPALGPVKVERGLGMVNIYGEKG